MENAVDALKMAAAALIFIIAIGTSFSIFGTAKQTADSIIGMRDKQAYLESASLDNGILYTSSSVIQGDTTGLTAAEIEEQKKEESIITGVTKNGDRIVKIDDIISTIYRYSTEAYAVTIIDEDGQILARFSTATESYVASYNTYSSEWWKDYTEAVKENIKTKYEGNPKFGLEGISGLYKVNDANTNIKYDAKWLGNLENIERRINCDIYGGKYIIKNDAGNIVQEYTGKRLINELTRSGIYIVEVTNEIDNSKYLKEDIDEDGIPEYDTPLVQQYKMPTIEIVYIIIDR